MSEPSLELLDNFPALIWRSGVDAKCDYFNQTWLEFTGRGADQEMGDGWIEGVHPADAADCRQKYLQAFQARQPFRIEYRLRRFDGEYRWVLDYGQPIFNQHRQFAGYIGSCLDITERKHAEEELRNSHTQLRALSARLQSVREEEAVRIAREIHDELGQRLTGLKMDLLWTERKLAELKDVPAVSALVDRIVGATELVDSITSSVQQIATDLRPGVLDKLGLGSALQYEARRFQARSGLPCDVRLPAPEPVLEAKLAVALFRIFQECLTNVARHANASKVMVELQVEVDRVTMRVEDNGRGIPDLERDGPESLGFLGMKERAALLDGEVVVQRGEPVGTIVTTRIPRNVDSGQRKGFA